ncbi:hypothetical protein ACFQ1L_13785 [Phytohabitans flavus]|uniref:hypothetical protein n=1 Tax=Phytohabitans flavus TaxID=1076124 RepID=UPI00363FD8D4
MTIPFDSDAVRAAVAAAAHAVAAECERLGVIITAEQCETLTVAVISHYQAFSAGSAMPTATRART